jgi:hypothetical protein
VHACLRSVSGCPLSGVNYVETGDLAKLPLLCHYPVKVSMHMSSLLHALLANWTLGHRFATEEFSCHSSSSIWSLVSSCLSGTPRTTLRPLRTDGDIIGEPHPKGPSKKQSQVFKRARSTMSVWAAHAYGVCCCMAQASQCLPW